MHIFTLYNVYIIPEKLKRKSYYMKNVFVVSYTNHTPLMLTTYWY